MIVDITASARNDLESIGTWIARDNAPRAASFVAELIDRAESLSEGAWLYPAASTRRFPTLRRLNHGDYRILYLIKDDVVSVIHIHHGRRATPEAFD